MAGHPAPVTGMSTMNEPNDRSPRPAALPGSAPCRSNRGPPDPGSSLPQGPRSDPVSCRKAGETMGLFFADPLFENFAVSFGLGLGGQLGEVAAICAQISDGDDDAWYTGWSAAADRLGGRGGPPAPPAPPLG